MNIAPAEFALALFALFVALVAIVASVTVEDPKQSQFIRAHRRNRKG